MVILTKDDLHRIHLEEINKKRNKLINYIITNTKEIAIFNAKNGGNKIVKTYCNELQDSSVIEEVLSELKKSFPDSEVKVFTNDSASFKNIIVSVDWS
jgi:hypothetical protein